MRKQIFVGMVAAAALAPGLGFAQTAVEQGAGAGAAVGGAVGGIVGGTVGAAVQLPADVITAVTGVRGPSVRVEERIVVGEPLPPRVAVVAVPSHRDYSYAIVNDRRVIVEPRTRKIIHIIE
jgi:hypothetical protein